MTNTRGDVIGLYNYSGTRFAKYEYDAWGNVISITHQNGNAITSASNIANVNPIRYRGYYYDAEIGMYYLQSRYYDSQVGRFINADLYADTGTGVLGSNMFAYCNNDSVNLFDYFGYSSYSIFKSNSRLNTIINSLLKNNSVLYNNASYYPYSATFDTKNKKVSMLFYNNSNAKTYLKKRAQEVYFYKTYTAWCYYISVENKNLLKKYSDKAIKRIAKKLMKYDKNLTLENAEYMIDLRIDEIENVVIPAIDDSFSLNIGFALDVISIASDLITVYYKKFSKEVKYISKILNPISSKYKNDNYYIFIPYFICYDSQVFYEVNYCRTGVC